MTKYLVSGTLSVRYSISLDAGTPEDACREVEEGNYNPVLDFDWHSEDIEVDDVWEES